MPVLGCCKRHRDRALNDPSGFSPRSTIDDEFESISLTRTSGDGRKPARRLFASSSWPWCVPRYRVGIGPAINRTRAPGYLRYCAACHGNDAGARGPVAEDLKASPRDLRYLGERYEMPLPTGTIARFIDGRQDVAAHGPKDMPM
jgi:hypothetical protein